MDQQITSLERWSNRRRVRDHLVLGLALCWPLSILPFATVHDNAGMVVGTTIGLASLAVIAGPFHKTPPSRALVVLLAFTTAIVLASTAQFLVVTPATRAVLQPGIAPVIDKVLALTPDAGTPLAIHPRAALLRWAFVGQMLLLATATALVVRRRSRGRILEAALIASGVALTLVAWIHTGFSIEHVWGFTSIPVLGKEHSFGPFLNPNHGGVACAVLLPFAVQFLRGGSSRATVLAAIAGTILLAGTLTSGSRAAPLVAGFSLLGLGVLARSARIRWACASVLGVSAAATGVLGVDRAMLAWTRILRPNDPSVVWGTDVFGDRPWFYSDALNLLQAVPWFGTGSGGFEDAFQIFKSSPGYFSVANAHSDLLQVMIEQGLVRGVLWVAILCSVLVLGLTRWLFPDDEGESTMVPALVASLAGLLSYALVDFPLQIGALDVYLALVAGGLVGLASRHARPVSWRTFQLVRVGTGLVFLGTLAALGWTVHATDDPGNPSGHAGLSRSRAEELLAPGKGEPDPDRALLTLHLSLRQRPLSVPALDLLGRTLEERGDFANAFVVFETLVRVHPSGPLGWLRLARLHQRIGNLDEAMHAWWHVLFLDSPDDETAERWVKEALETGTDPEQTLPRVIPPRADRYAQAASALTTLGHPEAAEAALLRAAQMEDRFMQRYLLYLLEQNRTDEIETLLPTLPPGCDAERITGHVLLRRKKYEDAISHFEAGLRLCGSRDEQVRTGLGEARVALGDEAGIQILEQVLERNPDAHRARRVLERALRRFHRNADRLEHLEYLVQAGEATDAQRRDWEAMTGGDQAGETIQGEER